MTLKSMGHHIWVWVIIVIIFSPICVRADETIHYTYDGMLRLIRVEYGDGTFVDYVYDNVGNRLQKTTTLTGTPANNPPSGVADPNIADGATEVSTTPTVSWTGGGDPDAGDEVVYYVYFGTPGNLSLVYGGWQPNF